jgi:hypothetical protein
MQYTTFEQLKNFVMQRRTAKLRAAGSHRAASFSDLDYFILGALSKLSEYALILSPTYSDAFYSCNVPHLSIHCDQVSPTSRKCSIFIGMGWLASYHQSRGSRWLVQGDLDQATAERPYSRHIVCRAEASV